MPGAAHQKPEDPPSESKTADSPATSDSTGARSRSQGRIKLSIEVSRPFNETLEALSSQMGISKSDVLRHGAHILRLAAEAQRRGLHLTFADADNTVRERLLLPFLDT